MTSEPPRTRPYRGVPADQRRARRRAALMEAGLELLGTRGWAATTVRQVCAEAGLNDRYFYENFPDRDALLLAIIDDQVAQGTDVILSAARQAPRRPQPRTRAVVTAILDFLTGDPRRAHILTHAFPASPLLQRRRVEIIRTMTAIFAAQTHETLDQVLLPDVDVELTGLTLTAGLWELFTTWFRGDLGIDRDHLVDYTVALVLSTTELATPLHQRLH
ncbi:MULTISPECIES: TetR/AcrR family transcriptional regulator [Actinomadura]|uniref:TetR/AcrR family transcriptional regulator n=1 Tax=Actinomadura TaxID=1988 RepID=UPI0003AD6F47|nr:TetR/AcrR family transcriptional regulator [Actinomadura madurae]MCP9951761.1 TetR/AcrR family transcriptional regulator [Actinomadura madurae]MCP9981000.1 TetR/AcrR family transcriptional regulator [Actinomadura madurae]MCQ0017198.1 TetR/AcrR family transcriptional regulator [Actinomadura madurae]URM97192.1 TetR/AcrR family transcriptional regulator [Actinomadura madurae]